MTCDAGDLRESLFRYELIAPWINFEKQKWDRENIPMLESRGPAQRDCVLQGQTGREEWDKKTSLPRLEDWENGWKKAGQAGSIGTGGRGREVCPQGSCRANGKLGRRAHREAMGEANGFSACPSKLSVKLAPSSHLLPHLEKGFFLEAGKGAEFYITFVGVKIVNSKQERTICEASVQACWSILQ